jgi:hypothetical protein
MKSLDATGIKKRLEDYEHMLLHYILTRMKNKMKDFEADWNGGRLQRNILQRS